MRFDDKPNRIRHGVGADKFAPIREAFDLCNHVQEKINLQLFSDSR